MTERETVEVDLWEARISRRSHATAALCLAALAAVVLALSTACALLGHLDAALGLALLADLLMAPAMFHLGACRTARKVIEHGKVGWP